MIMSHDVNHVTAIPPYIHKTITTKNKQTNTYIMEKTKQQEAKPYVETLHDIKQLQLSLTEPQLSPYGEGSTHV